MIPRLLISVFALLFVTCSGCVKIPDVVTLNLNPDQLELEPAVVIDELAATGDVLMIDINGLIAETVPAAVLGVGSSPIDDLVRRLDIAAKNPRVRAVVLRVNSPGGGVGASETMYNEIRRFSDLTGKPVVATMGEVAASGGYYISLAAEEIVAPESTITGSIGVIINTMNFSDGMSRIGIRARAVTSGSNKDLANPLEPMDESHYEILQAMVDEFYELFVAKVRERRPNMSSEQIELYTDGRVVTGATAVRVGLADSTGGIREAHEAAKRLAGMDHARLIKLAPSVITATTPYASVQAPENRPLSGLDRRAPTGINAIVDFLQSQQRRALPVGAYYLWLPPAS